jgi:uncharacterized membrane protein YesL
MPAGWVIKVSFYMTFRHFPVSLLLLLLFGVSYLLILKIPLLVVFVPGIATLLSSFLIEPLLERHMPKEN